MKLSDIVKQLGTSERNLQRVLSQYIKEHGIKLVENLTEDMANEVD